MMFPKNTRRVSEPLLEVIRRLPCFACAELDPRKALAAIGVNKEAISHPHHVISRGAGGDDVAENVIALCATHHEEIHKKGNAFMRARYPTINQWFVLTAAYRGEEVISPRTPAGRKDPNA